MAGAGAMGFPQELMVQRIQSLVEEGFWIVLCCLKLDVLGTDDSPIPITGPLAHNAPLLVVCL
jgi:ubiquitin-like modifier-activating enzyme ATG7